MTRFRELLARYFVRFARADSIFGPYPQERDRAVLTAKTACPNLEALASAGKSRCRK